MKTFSPKHAEIKREWFVVDLKGKTLGKAATKIADILRGKHKTIFVPYVDCGDYVVAINAKEIHLTGNKLNDKRYYSHTKWPGGLKQPTAGELMERKPESVIEYAVAGMIPDNKLKKEILKKLKVYAGPEHKNQAQNPKNLEL